MEKLFLHHRYVDIPPRDVSGSGNDGIPHSIARGAGDFRHAAQFDGRSSWVEAPKTASMDDIREFRARVVFRLDPSAPAARRNLVEGHLSFAIFVDDWGAIQFSILDRNSNWTLCSSVQASVTPGRWHTVQVAHDGISESRIVLDAELVGRATAVPGPIRPVDNLGVAIGRWPDDAAYHFHGYLSEVALYKFDPEPQLNVLFGADCVDHEALAGLFEDLFGRVEGDNLVDWARSFQQLVTDAAQVMHAGDPDETDTARAHTQAAAAALGLRDAEKFRDAAASMVDQLTANVSEAGLEELKDKFSEVRNALPLTDDELVRFADALCLRDMAGESDKRVS